MLGQNTKIISMDDLYNERKLLQCFNYIEFENMKAFVNGLTLLDNYIEKNTFVININTKEELDQLKEIITHTSMSYIKKIYIRCNSSFHNEFEMIDRVGVILTDQKLFKFIGDWNIYNPIYREINLTRNNFPKQIRWIVDAFNDYGFRYFNLLFNYHSFEDMTMKELHKLEFWIGHLKAWIRNNKLIITDLPYLEKKVFYSVDNKLYYSSKKEILLFDIDKYKGKKGNDIPYKELNWLRQFIDITKEVLYFPFNREINYALIDWKQNIEIEGTVNSIPYITNIIGEMFNNA